MSTRTAARAPRAAAEPEVRLDRTPAQVAEAPELDDAQRAVTAHRGGPLLVLAGPGTGKTTTLVETMLARAGELRPEQILGLTFGRRAAIDWRERVTARLGGGVAPTVTTFHSFAYALVREQASTETYVDPLRLLSGPEQEQRLRDLLVHSVRDGRLAWPPALTAALGTRGLAAEVRALVARARALGLDPADLVHLGESAGELGPSWRAVGEFLEEYLQVLDFEGVGDYTEVVHRAALLAHDPQVRAGLHERYRLVLVDELQDVDAAQLRLLEGLVSPATTLVAAGDPDQSIYAFRGAEADAVTGFPDRFRGVDGQPAPVVVLTTTRRYGTTIAAAAGRVLRGASLAPLPAQVQRLHRSPTPAPGPGGTVDVATFDSESAQAAHVADLVRRAHLQDGLDWSQIAVVVRSARRDVPALRRALTAAGVPVQVAGDELPLAAEPAVRPLLIVLRAAADPEVLDDPTVRDLLLSPIGGADPGDLRWLGRALRARARDEGAEPAPSARLLGDLVRSAVAGPDSAARQLPGSTAGAAGKLKCCSMGPEESKRTHVRPDSSGQHLRPCRAAEVPLDETRGIDADSPPPRFFDSVPGLEGAARRALPAVRRVAAAVRAARESASGGASVGETLWAVWHGCDGPDGSGWPSALEHAALREGSRRADADLDAVVALFAAARREDDRFDGRRGVVVFLDELAAQQIPGDTLAEAAVRGPAVRLLTAHRAKGLQWSLVVVAGVHEGSWPDLRRRSMLLGADRLHTDGVSEPDDLATLLAQERRLFYVACTRARTRLVVTAVRSSAEDGPQPSRFVEEVAGGPVPHVGGRPPRPLSVAGLVARLRARASDPAASPALRAAAARRLAVLAGARDDQQRPLVPAADPALWWGTREVTTAEIRVRPADEPLALSGSQLTTLSRCPLQWFLQHEAHADTVRGPALAFGSVVHAVADAVARGEVAPIREAVLPLLEPVWPELGYEAAWHSAAEHADAVAALDAFLAWHAGRADRTYLASEHEFDVEVTVAGEAVRLRGSYDRVEADSAGRVHVADLKTGKTAPTGDEVARHAQLGVYQLTARAGGLAGLADDVRRAGGLSGDRPVPVGGAELVQLRLRDRHGAPKVQAQEPLGEAGGWVEELLTDAVEVVRGERFDAVRGPHCRTCPVRAACPADDEGTEVLP